MVHETICAATHLEVIAMSTATYRNPVLHPEVERWVNMARELGWPVDVKESVTFEPPGGPLVKVAAQPTGALLRAASKKIEAIGLEKAAQARQQADDNTRVSTAVAALSILNAAAAKPVQAPLVPAPRAVFQESVMPEPQEAEAAPREGARFVCPECAEQGQEWSSARGPGLGSHRSSAHGIRGTSRRAASHRVKKEAMQAPESRAEPLPELSPLEHLQAAIALLSSHDSAQRALIQELQQQRDAAMEEARTAGAALKDAERSAQAAEKKERQRAARAADRFAAAERRADADKRFSEKVVAIIRSDQSPLMMVTSIVKIDRARFE